MTLAATNVVHRRFNSGSVGGIGYPAAPRQITFSARRLFGRVARD